MKKSINHSESIRVHANPDIFRNVDNGDLLQQVLDKAHPQVRALVSRVIESGEVTAGYGEAFDFCKTKVKDGVKPEAVRTLVETFNGLLEKRGNWSYLIDGHKEQLEVLRAQLCSLQDHLKDSDPNLSRFMRDMAFMIESTPERISFWNTINVFLESWEVLKEREEIYTAMAVMAQICKDWARNTPEDYAEFVLAVTIASFDW